MNNQQNSTKFTPDLEQIAFADQFILSEGNVSKAFDELGRDRTVYYTVWRKQEGFEEWLSEHCREQVLKRRGQWYVWLEKYARAGSHKHLQTLLEIAKEFVPSPQVQFSFPQIKYVFNGNTEDYKNGRLPGGVVYTESGSCLDDTESSE